MRLTAEMLRAREACAGQVATFEDEWPDGVEITETVVRRAVELHLDIDWFAENFLTALALAEYNKVRAAAWAEYEKAAAAAWAEYQKVTAPALIAALELEGKDATFDRLTPDTGDNKQDVADNDSSR